MIELLGDRERHAVPVVDRAPPGRQHRPLGALALRLRRPAPALHELELRRPDHDGGDAQREAELHGRDAGGGAGHRGGAAPAGAAGTTNRVNSLSAG